MTRQHTPFWPTWLRSPGYAARAARPGGGIARRGQPHPCRLSGERHNSAAPRVWPSGCSLEQRDERRSGSGRSPPSTHLGFMKTDEPRGEALHPQGGAFYLPRSSENVSQETHPQDHQSESGRKTPSRPENTGFGLCTWAVRLLTRKTWESTAPGEVGAAPPADAFWHLLRVPRGAAGPPWGSSSP